ncbi:ankyrin repeat domain-containing protein 53 [Brachionichthys hirsutus]|uniref:ankyrin repeat domain-containing protein 53 n=1 Tax=Brachionichthys hirsutus TaxID=412623 RepID=UPI0036046366
MQLEKLPEMHPLSGDNGLVAERREDADLFCGSTCGSREDELERTDEDLSALHTACLYGQLDMIQLLLESRPDWINSSDLREHRPIHMALSSRSTPNTSLCLNYLVEHGAEINAKTDSGMTPLHLASSEGLLDCTEILIQAGADVSARDGTGHTPLDMARIWCHRKVARYLKSCMWQEDKKKEMQERKRVQVLYSDLVDIAKQKDRHKKTLSDEKMAQWATNKGFPPLKDFSPRVSVSQYHVTWLPSDQNTSSHTEGKGTSTKRPLPSFSRPWSIFVGPQSEKPPVVPDLRGCVTVRRGSSSRRFQYTTKWDSTPRPAPDLPLDTLERALFPRAFPSRIASPRHFEPQDIVEVQHRGYPRGQSTSPWTEVAMHLSEVLEPGRRTDL